MSLYREESLDSRAKHKKLVGACRADLVAEIWLMTKEPTEPLEAKESTCILTKNRHIKGQGHRCLSSPIFF